MRSVASAREERQPQRTAHRDHDLAAVGLDAVDGGSVRPARPGDVGTHASGQACDVEPGLGRRALGVVGRKVDRLGGSEGSRVGHREQLPTLQEGR